MKLINGTGTLSDKDMTGMWSILQGNVALHNVRLLCVCVCVHTLKIKIRNTPMVHM